MTHHHEHVENINDLFVELVAHMQVLSYHTQLAHWHVKGCAFKAQHEMFGEHYELLTTLIDDLVEHLRYRHGEMPPSLTAILSLLEETECPIEDSALMIAHLHEMTEEMIARIEHAINICNEHNRQTSMDILIGCARSLEKMSWFYRSTLEDSCLSIEACDCDCCDHEDLSSCSCECHEGELDCEQPSCCVREGHCTDKQHINHDSHKTGHCHEHPHCHNTHHSKKK